MTTDKQLTPVEEMRKWINICAESYEEASKSEQTDMIKILEDTLETIKKL